ncbi:MAG: acetolactate decarboxylase [Candidatus Omnitrophota bacterium]|jgi:acetolactate decarboxylase|nr:MAG: acetolactate decarboxylase [Candidatus Omnitrophota bacterium]
MTPEFKKRKAILFFRILSIALLFSLSAFGQATNVPAPFDGTHDLLFQTAPIGSLMVGVYDGEVAFADLKQHGDFGLGTVNGLDGEMIALDGEFYQIRTDGVAYRLADEQQTPFASVTFFQPDAVYSDVGAFTYDQLQNMLLEMMPSKNYIYAIKITGRFKTMETRSVPKQQPPYAPLTEVVANQTIFKMSDVQGVLIGFWSPAYTQGLNVPGYHFHFITDDRTAGGHLLDCIGENATIEIDYKFGVAMIYPRSATFADADLSTEGLEEVERPKSNLRFFNTLK